MDKKTEVLIETWFPKTIYSATNLHLSNLPKYKKEILKVIAKKSIRTDANYVETTHGIRKEDLKNNSIFKALKKDILTHANNYSEALGYDLQLQIGNMWANVSKKEDYLFPHNHPNSLLSGVFYVSANEKLDTIKFYNNIDSMLLPVPKQNLNELSYETCTHSCIPGKLLIFKSDFLHGCPALKGEEKIVISFNITSN
jgi:uncharacterized protein (TIGR02466 family)